MYMSQSYRKKHLIASVIIVSAIAMVFLFPWLFSMINGKANYYGLYVDKAAYNFSLANTNGIQTSLEDLSGSYIYLMFGFTHCQEVCPLQLNNLLAINRLVGDRPVRFAFITLDPDRDTKKALKQYFEVHGDNFIALRPKSFQASQALAMNYLEYAFVNGQKKTDRDYNINHNGYIFLLNPDGLLKLIYTSTQLNHSEMLKDLKKLIKTSK